MPKSYTHFHSSFSSFWFISLCSFVTQCHAIRQPANKPNIKQVKVQENDSGCFLSSHIPNAAPSKVGTATVQPIIPNIPNPNQTLLLLSPRAFNLRFAFSPTSLAKLFVPFFSVGFIIILFEILSYCK